MPRSLCICTATRWPSILTAGLVLLLGGALRFAYYDSAHGPDDEDITIEVVRYMRHSGDWDVNWAKASLSPNLRYDQYNFSSYLYATFYFYRIAKLVPGTDRWRAEREGFLVYRFFVAALATLAVWQTFHLGRQAGGSVVAVGAGALVSVAPLLVQDAHYLRPEAFTTVLTLAAVALSWPQPTVSHGRTLGAGFCLGLLLACKVSMLLLIWIPFVPIFMAGRAVPVRGRLALLAGAAIVAGFAAGAPTAVLHPHAFLHGVRALMTQYAGLHPPHSHLMGTPVGDMLLDYFIATLGWPLLGAFVVGAGWLAARRQWAAFFLLVVPVVLFAGYFSTRRVFFERNVSHVVPLFAVVAAIGISHTATWLASRVRLPAVLISALVFGGVSLRAVTVTWPLLAVEYRGHAAGISNAFADEVRARYPSAEWRNEILLTDVPLKQLAARFQATKTPVLFVVSDYRDEWTAWNYKAFQQQFVFTEVAVTHGAFPGVPTSTLLTYYGPTTRYLLVTGVRPP